MWASPSATGADGLSATCTDFGNGLMGCRLLVLNLERDELFE